MNKIKMDFLTHIFSILKTLVVFIVYAILTLLYIPATIINLIVVAVKYRHTLSKSIFDYCKEEIREIDIFVGCSFRASLNAMFVKTGAPDAYKFGSHRRETMSSVFGKNLQTNTLTKFGRFVAINLDYVLFEKNHCLNAIDSHVALGQSYCILTSK